MTADDPRPAGEAEQTCVHCGVEVRTINWALGPELMHSPYPHHTRQAYRHCMGAVAELGRPAASGAERPAGEAEALRDFAEWVLSIADDPPQRRTVTLEEIIQRAALACDPDLHRPAASGGATDGERDERTAVQRDIDASLTLEQLAVHQANRAFHTAPVASQADGELRAQLEQLAMHKIAYVNAPQLWGRSRVVDAVLALPAVQQLLADAEAVQRVRELIKGYGGISTFYADEVRRALDGDPA